MKITEKELQEIQEMQIEELVAILETAKSRDLFVECVIFEMQSRTQNQIVCN